MPQTLSGSHLYGKALSSPLLLSAQTQLINHSTLPAEPGFGIKILHTPVLQAHPLLCHDSWHLKAVYFLGQLPQYLSSKGSACNAGDARRMGPVPRSGRSPGEMATHSSTPIRKIPWTEKPGGLQSIRSQRVGQDWATEHTHSGDADVNKTWHPTSDSSRAVTGNRSGSRELQYFEMKW